MMNGAPTQTTSKPKGHNFIMATSQEFGELKAKVDVIDERLEKIDEKLFGNGKPGIVVDLVVLHKTIEALADKVEAIGKKADKVDGVETTENWLKKHWKGIVISITAGFLVLHSLIPANFDLWTFLMKLL